MSKTLELVIIFFLFIIFFVLGVVYSSSVKQNFDWLFEAKEQEVEITKVPTEVKVKQQEEEFPKTESKLPEKAPNEISEDNLQPTKDNDLKEEEVKE
jgi:hypothetical protein